MSYLDEYKVSIPEGESGAWKVMTFEIADRLSQFRMEMSGRGCPPGRYTRLGCQGVGLFMSDTYAEISDILPFVRIASGHVLISGLGLGLIIRPLLQKLSISSITIVEKEADVIRLVAPSYVDNRLRIVNADALLWKPDLTFDWAWHDIWPDICTDNLPQMATLKRRYARAMNAPGRQFCWSEGMCRAERRRDSRHWRWAA